MKIKYAIVSSDQNEMYLDFWNPIMKVWSQHIKIKPILVLISDKNNVVDYGDYIIHEIKKIEDIDTGLQSQISRMYVTKFYNDDICITSDIDMIPLGFNYFNNIVNDFDDNSLIILSSDAYKNENRYPLCYNVGKGETFNEIMDFNVTFDEYVNRILTFNWGWDSDELYFGLKVNEFNDNSRIKKLNRGWTNGIAHKRIDRCLWYYNEKFIKDDFYIDCHSLRPYKNYKNEIDKLINIILKQDVINEI